MEYELTSVTEPVWYVGPLGWWHVIAFGVVIPLLAVRSRRVLADPHRPLPDRVKHFRATAFNLLAFGGFSCWVAYVEGIDLFPARMPSLVTFAAGVVMYVVTVAFMQRRWRRAVEQKKRIVHLFTPETTAERAWWVGVSVLAGVTEEITWRGVQTVLLANLLGSYAAAALVSAALFGVAHWVQGWKSAAVIALFSLGFAGLVWLSGSLYVAMLVHAAYDVTAGVMYGKLARELGYRLEPAPPDAGAGTS